MIGVFDSGVGGISVWKEIVKIMPEEPVIYFGDSGFCPYGHKSKEEIIERVDKIAKFLISQKCDIITVACNTVTAAAIDYLRANYKIPFVGMEPAVKPAIINSKSGVIGVLATKGTLMGALYKRTLKQYGKNSIVIEKAGDGLVELVESGETDSPAAEALLRKYISPMLEKKADHIVLGCTHYPFLIAPIKRIAGPDVTIVNPAPAVAKRTLELAGTSKPLKKSECFKYQFYTSGSNLEVISKLIGDYAAQSKIVHINL